MTMIQYHADPVTDDMIITVINDDSGFYCGLNYEGRKRSAATKGIKDFRAACRKYDDFRVREYRCERATRRQISDAAAYLMQHYKWHNAGVV